MIGAIIRQPVYALPYMQLVELLLRVPIVLVVVFADYIDVDQGNDG
jgi:hypothetical protein